MDTIKIITKQTGTKQQIGLSPCKLYDDDDDDDKLYSISGKVLSQLLT
jgi:hypothetical protein